MEFLYFLVTQHEPTRDLTTVPAEIDEQVDLAREGGFDAIRTGEHHVTDDFYLLNEPVIAYMAANSGEMDVMTGLCLLPYHNPIRIAEYGATVDVLTNGGFRFAVGQGYRPEEFEAFGIDKEDAPGRLEEGIEVITRLWTEDGPVSYDGEHFQFEELSINPQPVQDPRPPIIVGASNESSIRRAARISDGWWASHVPFDIISEYVDVFRDERRDDGIIGLTREMFVAETDKKAEKAVQEPLMDKYKSYTDWGQSDVFETDTFEQAWVDLKENRFIIGSPDTVIHEIGRYKEAFDIDFISPRMQYPGMTFEDIRPSVELFVEEVMPSFR